MQRYCIIGYPVGHSLSPKVHNRWFKKLRIPARYEKCEVKPADLAKFMRNFRAEFSGANVTIPHKEKIVNFLDALSPEARKIGAVNCIVNKGGKLIGYNTDVYGAMEALEYGIWNMEYWKIKNQRSKGKSAGQKSKVKFLKGEKIIVLGSGGAARAVVYGLKKAGAKVVILNRTLSRAKKLAKKFGCKYGRLTDFGKEPFDLLINTTNVGMVKKIKSQMSKVKTTDKMLKVNFGAILKSMREKPTIMDIVYTPRMTKLLRNAKKAGCKIITGDKMFLAQAARSFELWTNKKVIRTKP